MHGQAPAFEWNLKAGAAVNAWSSACFRMEFEGISSEAGVFVILGHGFTYIISNLITVLQACGSLWTC